MRKANGTYAPGFNGKKTHGMAHTRVYSIWWSMRTRCENPNSAAYDDYAGRGITVCERWKSFANFHADMGEPPVGMTLDRIDNDAGYSPDNCRWATRREQSLNRRNRRMISAFGQEMNISQWAEVTGINEATLRNRLDQGWEHERIVSTPVKKTHCPKGHELTLENTIIQPNGRTCRTCARERRLVWQRDYRAKKKAAMA